jgi:hypothetical protein
MQRQAKEPLARLSTLKSLKMLGFWCVNGTIRRKNTSIACLGNRKLNDDGVILAIRFAQAMICLNVFSGQALGPTKPSS